MCRRTPTTQYLFYYVNVCVSLIRYVYTLINIKDDYITR